MELEDIPRLGAKRADALRVAGIKTVKDLAEADLRRLGPVEGISSEAFRKHKADARRLLEKNGLAYEKSPYGSRKDPSPARRAPVVPAASPVVVAPEPAPRRGLLARLFGR